MAQFTKGQRVVATKDIGGVLRDSVPKGAQGVVTEASWGTIRVLFTIPGGMFSSQRQAEITVSSDEIG